MYKWWVLFLEHLLGDSVHTSSGNSTGSDTELIEVVQTIGTGHLKEFAMSKKPKRKKNTRKRRPSIKHQQEPETNPLGIILWTILWQTIIYHCDNGEWNFMLRSHVMCFLLHFSQNVLH